MRGELAPLLGDATRVAIVHPPTQRATAAVLRAHLRDAGFEAHALEVPDGEAAKALGVAGSCWDELGRLGFTRTDAVVGLGGGSTTDLAGWVAAAWLRGVRVVQVPTTLAGMVDAAVGGKTGINTARGKNLVGAFHPPAGVLCDLDALRTLPVGRLPGRAGRGRQVRLHRRPGDPRADRGATPRRRSARAIPSSGTVERSVRVKAAVVGEDLTEQGRREILNYGHTLGHAIERAEQLPMAARRRGVGGPGVRGRAGEAARPAGPAHCRLGTAMCSTALGLPTSYRPDAWPALLETMRMDKKARGRRMRFVVLDGLARPGVVDDPDPALLAAAYPEVSAMTRSSS